MIALIVLAQVTMQTLAPGIARAVPPTHFSCEMTAADGGRFTLAGTTPLFPKGWDPNRSKFVEIQSSHAEAFRGKVGIDPGDAGEWFRDFQVSSGYPGVPQHTLQLKLRKAGASVAYVTRYLSTGEHVPFEYYAAGLCKADFAPAAASPSERG
jgi:hypothetical protein